MGVWTVELEPIKDWLDTLDKDTAYQVYAALDILREQGPNLRRPLVGKIEGSVIKSMKELRPGSAGGSEVRILFVFDPERKAIMLVGGDKQGKWNKWYKPAIREAEARYVEWLETHYGRGMS
ncbi:addiction module toxin RelE [Bifidobacterium myosotis]|uniref:Addiction module toxin RelE n=1 Tax=Bifidobacterium myosotis TaxID=1630166 RepID=A0A5M9ZIE7_9BIFI|nr:addiction module toxin RelE [Bifidobacterium myosotis]